MRKVAVFDMDNTLVRGSSLYYLMRRMLSSGSISKREAVRFGWWQMNYAVRKGENKGNSAYVLQYALAMVSGRTTEEIESVCREATDRFVLPSLIPKTLERLRQHQAEGHYTILATASPVELAREIGHRLGFDAVLGTTPRVAEGRYTGELDGVPLHGPIKADSVKSHCESAGLDLSNGFGYSDSINDLPLLCLVGNPAVVNADKDLVKVAKKNDWLLL